MRGVGANAEIKPAVSTATTVPAANAREDQTFSAVERGAGLMQRLVRGLR
jgi:hypothetical protein